MNLSIIAVILSGIVKEITDICCLNYVKSGFTEFRYELNHSKEYVLLEIQEKG